MGELRDRDTFSPPKKKLQGFPFLSEGEGSHPTHTKVGREGWGANEAVTPEMERGNKLGPSLTRPKQDFDEVWKQLEDEPGPFDPHIRRVYC